MTQSQITAERAELALRESNIQYEIDALNAQIWALEKRRGLLLASDTGCLMERIRLNELERALPKKGKRK